MQVYANSNRLPLKTILLFTAVLFVAFLPVSTFLFFIKNDAFNGYFPPKFFMSESIHAGQLPLWNPYINFGFPQYGDMSGGYWSPVTWLVASTVGYNAYTFTLEVLFYILLGGLGMYKLTSVWQLDNRVRIIAGVAFMCCGYTIGHLQHFNWLSGAAFLPWCFWSYYLLLHDCSVRNTIKAAIFFYMLAASAHPGIVISAVYFFIALLVFYFLNHDATLSISKRLANIVKPNILLVVILLLLSAGMFAGYLDILPFFVRGEKITLADSLSHPTNLQSWISVLLPFATTKNDVYYNTDPTMRNVYFSLTLLLFFLLACIGKKNNWQKFLLGMGILFALLSAGSIFKTFAYNTIPLIGYVRLNGEFRIFAILCFIIIAAIELDKFLVQKRQFSGTIKWLYYGIEIMLSVCILFGLYKAISGKNSFMYQFNTITAAAGLPMKLKALVDAISFYDTFWIQGSLQLLLWWSIKYCLKFQRWNWLMRLVMIDMIIACLLNIPSTGVGKASVAQVQQVLNKSPKGLPVPALIPIKKQDTVTLAEEALTGDWTMYNKQIGTTERVPYPVMLKNMDAYFTDRESLGDSSNLEQPFIFTNDTSVITLHAFAPAKIDLTVTSMTATTMVLQQNHYPHWYYYNNGSDKKELQSSGINFMAVPIAKGANNITLSFEPSGVKIAMFISCITFIASLVALLLIRLKRPGLSSHRRPPGP